LFLGMNLENLVQPRQFEGDEQVWVDYGALELQGQDADLATLGLPRCVGASCLASGPHELVLRATVAGEMFASDPIAIDFDVPCTVAVSDSGFAAPDSDSCSLVAGARSMQLSSMAWLCSLTALVLAARRRRY
jgi:hypothetical protein